MIGRRKPAQLPTANVDTDEAEIRIPLTIPGAETLRVGGTATLTLQLVVLYRDADGSYICRQVGT